MGSTRRINIRLERSCGRNPSFLGSTLPDIPQVSSVNEAWLSGDWTGFLYCYAMQCGKSILCARYVSIEDIDALIYGIDGVFREEGDQVYRRIREMPFSKLGPKEFASLVREIVGDGEMTVYSDWPIEL